MQDIIAKIIEDSVVAGAFLLLLIFIITKLSRTLDSVSTNMYDMSQTLFQLNERMHRMEKRMDQIDGGDR